jgi:nucleoside phosphorylase
VQSQHCPGIYAGVGKASSASVAASFRTSFSGIKLGIIVSICGAIPLGTDDEREILLGDIIISTGLIQFDFGRQHPTKVVGKDTLQDNLGRLNTEICAFLAKLLKIDKMYPIKRTCRTHQRGHCELDIIISRCFDRVRIR